MEKDIVVHTEFTNFVAEHPDIINADKLPRKWVAAAKVGQVVDVTGELCVVTAEALKSSVGTWKDGKIFDDHKDQKDGFKIYADKYEDPFLCFELDEQTIKNLDAGAGGSIDALATRVKDQKILAMTGVGYSILSKGKMPACTKEAGCAIPIAGEVKTAPLDTKWDFNAADYSIEQLEVACAWHDAKVPKAERVKTDYKLPFKTPGGAIVWHGVVAAMAALNGARGDVNISPTDKKTVYKILVAAYKLFEKQPPDLKAEIEINQNKGGIETMADDEKDKPVSYSKEQVAEIKAAAVADESERLTALHKVEMNDMTTVQAAELKTLGEKHVAEMETQRVEVQKRAEMIESLSTKYALSDEAKKGLTEAKTLADALALFGTLKVEKAEPVIAAEGGASGCGIVLGSEIEGEAPKTVKIEEVGSYNPYTRKYDPTYREELI